MGSNFFTPSTQSDLPTRQNLAGMYWIYFWVVLELFLFNPHVSILYRIFTEHTLLAFISYPILHHITVHPHMYISTVSANILYILIQSGFEIVTDSGD